MWHVMVYRSTNLYCYGPFASQDKAEDWAQAEVDGYNWEIKQFQYISMMAGSTYKKIGD